MPSRKKIRSSIIASLPMAEQDLVELLVSKVEKELKQPQRSKKSQRNNPTIVVDRIIQQEEITELGLK